MILAPLEKSFSLMCGHVFYEICIGEWASSHCTGETGPTLNCRVCKCTAEDLMGKQAQLMYVVQVASAAPLVPVESIADAQVLGEDSLIWERWCFLTRSLTNTARPASRVDNVEG